MSNEELLNALLDVEFCNVDTGSYYRAVAVCTESTGVVVSMEAVE